jgi:hypothetical protein
VSPPEQIASPTPPATDPPEVERELRFAVVMYGGVSLAIYINGVTQELLHMVRATARDPRTNGMLFPDNQLSATEVVYRKIARRLDERSASHQKNGPDDVTRTRFVVDIFRDTNPVPQIGKNIFISSGRSALLLVCAAISGFYLWFSFHALWTRPSLLEDLLGELFAAFP